MADSPAERRNGLKGRHGLDGALHLEGARSVHTVGVGFPIDVAFLSSDLTVLRVARLKPRRLSFGASGTRSVVAAQAGSLERWGVREGDQLEVREAE
jgi:uncharacterized protein